MVHGGIKYPSIFTVDGGARPPPLPPKPGRRQRSGVVQTLLVILVSVALCGMLVEACLIYNLYISKENASKENVSIILSTFRSVASFKWLFC